MSGSPDWGISIYSICKVCPNCKLKRELRGYCEYHVTSWRRTPWDKRLHIECGTYGRTKKIKWSIYEEEVYNV